MAGEAVKKGHVGPWYAWVVAGSGLFSQLICVMCSGIYGLCLAYVADSFGMVKSDLAIGASIYGLTYAGCSVFWGSLADKIGIRKTLTIASAGVGVMFVIIGLIPHTNPWTVLGMYAVAGVFVSGVGSAVLPKMMSNWFTEKHRGKGATVITAGGTLAGVINGIIGPFFILNMGGWQGCFLMTGILFLCFAAVIFIVARDTPASMGTVAFGVKPGSEEVVVKKAAVDKDAARKNALEVIKMPITWKFGIVFCFWQFWLMSHNAFLTSAYLEAGYDIVIAGLAGSVLKGVQFFGQILFPALSDRFMRKAILLAQCLAACVLYIGLYFVLGAKPDSGFLLFYIGCVGLFICSNPILQPLMAESYPPRLRGAGPGMISTIGMFGRFFGPLIAGWVIANIGGGSVATFIIWAGICHGLTGVLGYLFLPKTSGKYGDPLAKKEKEALAS